jgi:hypothetical protein
LQDNNRRLTYELIAFRDAIESGNTALFEEMAAQSVLVSSVLEQAHNNQR